MQAIDQRMVNRLFVDMTGDTIKAYIDDMLVKSKKEIQWKHTQCVEAFQLLKNHLKTLTPLAKSTARDILFYISEHQSRGYKLFISEGRDQ